mgnify:FL=1
MSNVDELLKQTKKLSDGSYGNIFSRNYQDSRNFIYICNLCNVSNILNDEALMTHANSFSHKQKIAFEYVPDANNFTKALGL